ncbi:unnamed protein product [Closterium sp. NIES-53]
MDGELKRPASEGATKEWDRRSKDGFFLLSQCLSSNQLHHVKHLIKDSQCGPKAWKILKDVHAPSSEAMVVVLERQLRVVKINKGDAVQGAFDQLRDLYGKLSAAGVDYPEKIRCYKALSLLPESWGPLMVNLNGMKDSWSLEWIRAQVLQEDFRRKELTAAAGEGGGSAYGMKGFKGRGSKEGKAKEGSRESSIREGSVATREASGVAASVGIAMWKVTHGLSAASYLTIGGLLSHQLKALRVFMERWEKAWAVRRAMEVPADMAACSTM